MERDASGDGREKGGEEAAGGRELRSWDWTHTVLLRPQRGEVL
jgi:hypothetical protein